MRIATPAAALSAHHFSLYFAGEHHELSRELLDAIHEAGCDDSHVGTCDGVLRIAFDREAPSFREALTSAIADVEKADLGLILSRVASD